MDERALDMRRRKRRGREESEGVVVRGGERERVKGRGTRVRGVQGREGERESKQEKEWRESGDGEMRGDYN